MEGACPDLVTLDIDLCWLLLTALVCLCSRFTLTNQSCHQSRRDMPEVFRLPVYRSPAGASTGYGTPSLASCSFTKSGQKFAKSSRGMHFFCNLQPCSGMLH